MKSVLMISKKGYRHPKVLLRASSHSVRSRARFKMEHPVLDNAFTLVLSAAYADDRFGKKLVQSYTHDTFLSSRAEEITNAGTQNVRTLNKI